MRKNRDRERESARGEEDREKINCKRHRKRERDEEKNENPHANIILIGNVKAKKSNDDEDEEKKNEEKKENEYNVVMKMRREKKIFRVESEQSECMCARVSAAILSLHLFILTDFFFVLGLFPSFSSFDMYVSHSFTYSLLLSHPFLSIYQVKKVWPGIDGLVVKRETTTKKRRKMKENEQM